MSKKSLGLLTVLALLLFAVSAFVNLVLLASLFFGSSLEEGPPVREIFVRSGPRDAKIAHIDLEGMITNVGGGGLFGTAANATKTLFEKAESDAGVRAVVLRVNSPGGEITASDILYNALKRLAAKKPVVVYMDTIGASGGYYVACGGSYIMANDTTMTGSIGVIIQALNYKELLGKVGLDSVVFTSGKFKDMLSPSREMREEERVYIQGMVDEMYNRFLGIVSRARNISEDALRGGVADGRVMTGQDALAAKLIDATGYIEDAYAKAMELAGVRDAMIVRYGRPLTLGSLLGILGSASEEAADATADVQRVQLELRQSMYPPLQPGCLYLLPQHFAW